MLFIAVIFGDFFRMVAILIKCGPIGAFGAFAFTIGKYGIDSIADLAALIVTFYVTSVLFIAIVLRLITHARRFSIWKSPQYLKEEIWLVIGTSSSEAALPSLMKKLGRDYERRLNPAPRYFVRCRPFPDRSACYRDQRQQMRASRRFAIRSAAGHRVRCVSRRRERFGA